MIIYFIFHSNFTEQLRETVWNLFWFHVNLVLLPAKLDKVTYSSHDVKLVKANRRDSRDFTQKIT